MLFPIAAKEGLNTPAVDVETLKLQVPAAGWADNEKEPALEHKAGTAVILRAAALTSVRLVVPTFEHVAAAVGVTTTE